VRWLAIAVAALWLLLALLLVAARWIDPPTDAVHIERHLQALIHSKPYHERYTFVPLSRISPDFQHAVIAAEDIRGGSTITQQLVKNLFFGTGRSFLRKGAEFTLVPIAELVLGKQRILELYLNEIEWGPGIFGAEAASRAWYDAPAAKIGREQGARLAAILPDPRRRRPARMDHYSTIILDRMGQMGW
jgi:monofunctional biosynthetic peptidoglycan transglycosylase